MKQIAQAFIAAKKSFAPALKCASNPHFKTKYADLASCLEAVDDALLSNGIAVYQETSEDAAGVTVETVFLHESGESLRSGKLHVPASKQDPQGYGSALTYARRYSLMAACGIAPEDDDGNAASRPAPKPPVSRSQTKLEEKTFADYESSIRAAASLDELKTAFAAAYKAAEAKQDSHAMAVFTDAKDTRKAQLTTKEAA